MKVFWDTNLFVYLWEKKSFVLEMAALEEFMEDGGHVLTTSALTLGEVLVLPMRAGEPGLVAEYEKAMRQLVLIPFGTEAAVCFSRLRARNPGLRPPDAIQLACAVTAGCGLFLTNDERLAGVDGVAGIRVESLRAWGGG